MNNMFVVVGKIQYIENEYIIVSVPRAYEKDEEGNFIQDVVRVVVKGSIFKNVKEYCKIGDIIGIKGMIQTSDKNIELVAEKVTFLSSSKNK